jgi:ketosteroid isomerase-like protein
MLGQADLSVTEAIAAANRGFQEAFARGDAAGAAAVYTEDAEILPPNSETMHGRAVIQGFWQGALDMGIKGATLETVELETYPTGAVEVGKYSLSVAGGQVVDHGKFIVIWKQEGGDWKWHRDIWNSSLPAPQ